MIKITGDKVTAQCLLLPVALTAFALLLFFVFQTATVIDDHKLLYQAYAQQEPQLAQLTKIKDQANALAIGTLKLAQQGDKDAQDIIDRLKKSGVNVQQ